MEYNNSNISNSTDSQNDNIVSVSEISIESIPEILPQYIIGENNQENHSIIEFNPRNLPNIIAEQGKTLNEFCIQKEKAKSLAKAAKKKAEEAKKKEVGLFSGKQVAIKELQEATLTISEALGNLTKAVNKSYENQEKIAKVNEYLLGLGLTNTTLNRMVIRELEMKLNNASPEELSELAKQELMSVLRQLKAQEDIQNRLEKQAEGLRFHDEKLEQQENALQTLIEKENNLKISVDQVKIDFNKKLESAINNLRSEVINRIDDINKTIKEKDNKLNSSINQSKTEINNKLDSNIKRFDIIINDITNRQNDTLDTYKRENETLKYETNLLSKKVLKLQGHLKWYSVVSVVAIAIAIIGLMI